MLLRFLLLAPLLLLLIPAQGQLQLDGLWEGTLTIGGIESRTGYRLEIYIERKGNSRVEGRSYLHVSPQRIVEMRFSGTLYSDFSLYIDEVAFMSEGDDFVPDFMRKYQLQWKRSVEGSSLNGYWQEIRERNLLDETRQRGRVFLHKVKDHKA
ncbi:MAG: hypothetical protein D6772_13735 [Bacteroidetes bacterium]|nr:MAG: hypothetical protein D6772_13735 [Bacteroidota bacterium]